MNRKCFNIQFYDDLDPAHHHEGYGDAAFMSFEEPDEHTDFEQLGRWILQAEDGEIDKHDFQQLNYCLATNPAALKYYTEFVWLCAALHSLYGKKQAVLT